MPTFCTECGTTREGDEPFCVNCGAKYDGAGRRDRSAEPPDEAPEESVGHGAGWYVGLSVALAAVLIGAVIGGGALLRNRVSSADVTDTPVTGVRLNSDGYIVTGAPGEESTPGLDEPSYSEEPTYSEEPSYTEQPQYTPEPTTAYTEETLAPATALGNAIVSVEPGITDNATARTVVALLTGYFTAINERDYTEYRKVVTRGARQTQAEFEKGYRTTNNSQVLLRELATGEDGRLMATVDFVSTQDAADGPNGQTCTRWTVAKYFEKENSKLRIGKALKGHSSASPC